MVKKEYLKFIAIPDVHVPYEDKQSVRTVLRFVKDQQPDHVVLIGDVLDNYSISHYDKNPERSQRLQWELDRTQGFLTELRRAAGIGTRITYLEGNHELRMQKYLWKHPEIHGLKNMELPKLLELEKNDVDYCSELVWKNAFIFTHGKKTTIYAPRVELDTNGMSGMSGHSHRRGSHYKTSRTGVTEWHSIGHLCDAKKAEYASNPNWQQGLGVVRFSLKNKDFFAESLPIVKHKIIYDGKLYKPNGVSVVRQ